MHISRTAPSAQSPDIIKRFFDKNFDGIRFFLDSQKREIENFNEKLPKLIQDVIQDRQLRLKAHNNIVKVLDIPLKRKEGAPEIMAIPLKKKLIRPLPQVPERGFKPEPGIDEENYNYILRIIRHEGRTFEAVPNTFALHDEVGLRDIILAHLNGHLEGGATGETFRKRGKTDIHIEEQNREAFVAECKIWQGEKQLIDAVNQLLGYLTWRDCKSALVIFNKHNMKFNELLDKVPDIIKCHSKFKKEIINDRNVGEWRFKLVSDEDDTRNVIVHVFLFNLYVNKK